MENNKMNVYSKLARARVNLQKLNLKKSGVNKFAGFKYFELSDFLPSVNNIFDELGLCSVMKFGKEEATLTIINAENIEEQVVFYSPVVELNLKGTNAIQNMGGAQTYLRRYLYMMAMEIVESDEFDAVCGANEEKKKLSDAQIKRMFAIAGKVGVTMEQVISTCRNQFKIKDVSEMTKEQYDEICNRLENKAN